MNQPNPQRFRRLPRNGSWCLWVGCLFIQWSISCLRWCFRWWKTFRNWAKRWCLRWFWCRWWAIYSPFAQAILGLDSEVIGVWWLRGWAFSSILNMAGICEWMEGLLGAFAESMNYKILAMAIYVSLFFFLPLFQCNSFLKNHLQFEKLSHGLNSRIDILHLPILW